MEFHNVKLLPKGASVDFSSVSRTKCRPSLVSSTRVKNDRIERVGKGACLRKLHACKE